MTLEVQSQVEIALPPLANWLSSPSFSSSLDNSQMTLLETLIFTQISSAGACNVLLTTGLFLLRNIFARQNIRLSRKVLKEMPLFSNCLTCSRYVLAGDYIFGRTCTIEHNFKYEMGIYSRKTDGTSIKIIS